MTTSVTGSALEANPSLLLREGQLVEHFKVKRLLGRGGMSQVFLARDLRLGRNVALKLIKPELLGASSTVRSFLQEARATARFNHPNIVYIYAVGEYDGCPYVALEYLEGESLRERVAEGVIPLREVLRFGLAICEALSEAHHHKVLHCDLKPENILLPYDGRLRVVDFGLARVLSPEIATISEGGLELDSSENPSLVTQIRGTPAYMAPEQWRRGSLLSPATDVWAVGVMMFEMLMGERPFQGESMVELRNEICRDRPLPVMPDRIPGEVRLLIEGCLERVAKRRATIDEIKAVLQQMLHFQPEVSFEGEEPFRGLEPFQEDQSHLFFGRDAEVAAFLEKIRRYPVLPVIGPSGAGKSSFVLAGVVPRLREQGRWLLVRTRPQRDPFLGLAQRLWPWLSRPVAGEEDLSLEEMAAHLNAEQGLAEQLMREPRLLSILLHRLAERHRKQILLVVDQLEELLTLVSSADVRQRFVEALHGVAEDASDPVRLVFTLRDDYLGRFVESYEAQQMLNYVTLLRIPDATALREILVRPIDLLGYRYPSQSFVDRMISEVEGEAASLPLLQFACRILWERRDQENKLLLESVYEAIGGVGGALSEHADGVLQQLPPVQVQAVREIFLRLVTPERTRRVVWQHELLDGLGEDGEKVLQTLVQARLLAIHRGNANAAAAEDTQVEIVHESMVQRWHTLHHWIDESHEEQLVLQELRQVAELWKRRGGRVAEVWQGEALQEALAFRKRYRHALPQAVEQFLEAGQVLQRRRRRTRQLFLAGVFAIGSILLVLSLLASLILQRKNKAISERWSLAQQYATRSALLRKDYIGAYAHLRASLENRDSPALRAFWRRLQLSSLLWQRDLNTSLEDVAFAPKRSMIAVAGRRGGLFLLHTRVGQKVLLRGHRSHVMSLAFSSDGKWLASGSWNGNVRLWRMDQPKVVLHRSWRAHRSPVQSLSFHPNSMVLVSGGYDGVRLWNTKEKNELRWKFVYGWRSKRKIAWSWIRGRRANSVKFSKNGKWLALAGYGVVYLIHWKTRRVRPLRMSSERIYSLAFSADQRWLATAGMDRKISVLDLKKWRLRKFSHGHTNVVTSVSFHPKLPRLVTAGFDKTIRVWELPSFRLLRILRGHTNVIRQLAFSSKGEWMASVSGDQSVRMWRAQGQVELRNGSGHTARVTSISFGPLGKMIASGGADRAVHLWDSWSGRKLLSLRGHRNAIRSVSLSPDGMRLVSNGYDKTIRVWRIQRSYSAGGVWRGREVQRFRNYALPRYKKPFSAEGNKMLMMRGSLLHIWDLFSLQKSVFWDAGSVAGASRRRSFQLSDVAFHPKSSLLVSADYARQLKVWRVSDRKAQQTFLAPDVQLELQVGPMGRFFASMGRKPHIYLWDTSEKKESRVLKGHKGFVSGLAFGPLGKQLASSSIDGSVWLWELSSKASKPLIKRERGRAFYSVAFRPDGGQVAAASSEQKIYLWDLPSGAMKILPGHAGGITALQYSPDSKILASSGTDGTLRLWLSQENRPLWRTSAVLPARGYLLTHRGWSRLFPTNKSLKPKASWSKQLEQKSWQSQSSPNGRYLAVQTSQKQIEIWDILRDTKLYTHTLPGLSLFRVDSNGYVWALAKQRLWFLGKTRKVFLPKSGPVLAFALERESLWVATQTQILKLVRRGKSYASTVRAKSGGRVSSLSVVRAWLAIGYHSGQIRWLHRTKEKRPLPWQLLELPLSALTHIIAGPKQTVALGFQNGTIGIWSLTSRRLLEKIRLNGPVQHLSIYKQYLIGATSLGSSMVWDLKSYQLPHCQLLRDVWKQVPMVWSKGRILLQKPPSQHKCQRNKK